MNPSDAIEAIEKPLSSLPYSLSRHILEHLRKLTSHEPVIGIMGKSGAGKSSLCNRAEMSPKAAGIAACLMTYSHHACRMENYAMTVHYYRLRDYALQHPECSAIMRIID